MVGRSRLTSLWFFLAMTVFPDLTTLQYGDSWTGILHTMVIFEDGAVMGVTANKPQVQVVVKGLNETATHSNFGVCNAKVLQVSPLVIEVGESSRYFPIPLCTDKHLCSVVELCSGAGIFSSMSKHVGLEVVLGVDKNPAWSELFLSFHQGSRYVVGEVGDQHVLDELVHLDKLHPLILAGVACQPHSRAGDKLGVLDPRADSLPQTLKLAWMVQSPLIILECVAEIQDNREVQTLLREYCNATGYVMTQKVLHLAEGWCTRRTRWFACLSSPVLGPLEIPDMPKIEEVQCVEHVLPTPMLLEPTELSQLQLSLYELSKFHEFACGGIQKLMLNGKSQLPTCLHSAGNQLYPCRCGCHKGFSLQRLQSKGLYGTLIGLHNGEIHNGIFMEHCRYLHPDEMLALHGGMVPYWWGPDLRLALAAVGQSVAPLQALWIVSHAKAHVQLFLQQTAVVPADVYQHYVQQAIAQFRMHFPKQIQRAPPANDQDEWIEWDDHTTCVPSRAKIPRTSTVAHLLEAEAQLTHFLKGGLLGVSVYDHGFITDHEGNMVDSHSRLLDLGSFAVGKPSSPVVSREFLPCPCGDWQAQAAPTQACSVSPTLPFEVQSTASVSLLPGLKGRGFLHEQCPSIPSLGNLEDLLAIQVPKDSRSELLSRQGDLWADDELRFQLTKLCSQAPMEQQLVMWDPLLVSHVVRYGNFGLLRPLIDQVGEKASVVTGVLIEQHWYPLMWRFDTDNAWGFTCGHVFGYSVAINKLQQFVSQSKSFSPTAVRYHRTSFPVTSCCGALAIAYLEHLVWGTPMPDSPISLMDRHKLYREDFMAAPDLSSPRPWIWGLGEGSWTTDLQQILVQHGVLQVDSAARAQLVVEKLGLPVVQQALKSSMPWKELKWHASQCNPMFQIIRPSELQNAIEAKASSGRPVGNRQQKKASKGKGKGKPASPSFVDPRGLRVEEGLFTCGPNIPLSQLNLTQVGPVASGIVLCTGAEAEPFLKTGRPISTGGLALIVVDQISTPPATTLLAESIRFPTWCIANSEPLLLDGLLYQVGAQQVTRSIANDRFELISVSTCVIKFMLFRDQLPVQWETVVAHPVKYLLSNLPTLQVCAGCDNPKECEHWHEDPAAQVADPLMEVWGRQFLSIAYHGVPAEKADIFSVHMRLPVSLEEKVLQQSGRNGLYCEPKEIDGKKPSASYQVFWMPKSSYQEIVHLRQVTRGVSGIARMGQRYGIRCHKDCAEEIHAMVKPGGAYLPQGRKSNYIMGPMPFGTLRSSIMQIVEMLNWAARPMQPITAASHIQGVMWRLQAVDPPPRHIVQTDHGEVLISRVDEPSQTSTSRACVVGARHTLSLISAQGDKGIDVLQICDPWEQAVNRGVATGPKTVCKASDPVEVLEKKVADAVIARLPSAVPAMEVDGQHDELASKVAVLEQQVQELHSNQTKMHSMVSEQSQAQSSQIASLQAQSQRMEAAISDQAGKLGSFQVQFKQQLERQQGQLDNLFQQQMDRIEDLFQKKARTS